MARDVLKQYSIPFVGLKEGKTTVSFDVEESFFKELGGSEELEGANITVDLVIDKRINMLILDFYVEGTIHVTCDRCLNELDQPVLDEYRVYVKFHQDAEVMDNRDEDVIYLLPGETHLQVAQLIYDFVHLSIPLQKGCAPNEVGGPKCNLEMLEYLQQQQEPQKDENEDEIIDQRWSALKKLKSNNDGTSETEN